MEPKQCEPYDSTGCILAKRIWSTVPVALLITGTFGNILNVVILSRRKLRGSTTTVYLLCLSVSDCTFLWLGMGPRAFLQGYGKDVKLLSQFACKIISFAPVTAATFSTWSLVLLTVERVLLTKWPMKARSRMTLKKARIAAAVTLLLIVSLTSHFFIVPELRYIDVKNENGTVTDNKLMCTYAPYASMLFYKKIWQVIILFVLTIFPTTLVILGNVTIIFTILAQRRKLMKVIPIGQTKDEGPKKVKSATKMLILVSAMFMLTTMPFSVGNVVMSVFLDLDEPSKQLGYAICRNIFYCNFTFNFVLYFLNGTLFKSEWKAIMRDVNQFIQKKRAKPAVQNEEKTTEVGSTSDQSKY